MPTARAAKWLRVLGEQERSGLSVAEFARRRGISAGSLGWWRYVVPVWWRVRLTNKA